MTDRWLATKTRAEATECAAKATKLIAILPLIAVWLQIRVLPGPPRGSISYSVLVAHSDDRTRNRTRYVHFSFARRLERNNYPTV
ncbi:hypothetical protein [Bradyrhizobium brasilense]|uniref:hypothetical protein n=1 Tax=Bradyrhizobium brasilense TaxID=1419277 RepID=UPI00115FC636|nr:hypothetical protein [Bradyrhizobium brasilense]